MDPRFITYMPGKTCRFLCQERLDVGKNCNINFRGATGKGCLAIKKCIGSELDDDAILLQLVEQSHAGYYTYSSSSNLIAVHAAARSAASVG